MHRLFRVLNTTDPDLASHGRRVGALAADVALRLGLDAAAADLIETAAQLHDIGKLFIPREILDKPGPLNAREWEELQHHPRIGFELVRKSVPAVVADIVLSHHERFDGTGYPNGIAGSRIPLEARVLQVADAFDAITSQRPYQPALPVEYAVSELERFSGTQFDPDAVAAILSLAADPLWLSQQSLGTDPADLAV